MSPLRNSLQSKCCCDVLEPLCYQLDVCESSTKCAEGGVFVSQLALRYLISTYGDAGYAVLCVNDECCVQYSFATQYDVHKLNSVLGKSPPAMVIYSVADQQHGTTIEDTEECRDACSSCGVEETGACCFIYRGKSTCVHTLTQEECEALSDHPLISESNYQGDGTCCDPPIRIPPLLCGCPDEYCIDCQPMPEIECDQYCGTCVVVDDAGNEKTTYCSGSSNDNTGCPPTVNLSFNFPSTTMRYPRGDCGDGIGENGEPIDPCSDPDCSESGQVHCCVGEGASMGTATMVLTKQDNENLWRNEDNQDSVTIGEQPDPAQQQPYRWWTLLGTLDGQYRFHPCYTDYCPQSSCGNNPPNPSHCAKCDDFDNHPECAPCASEQGYACPCCCGERWMTCWGMATVEQTHLSDCNDIQPTLDDGSSCWKTKILVTVMSTGCLEPYGNDGCNCANISQLNGCTAPTHIDAPHNIWSPNDGVEIEWHNHVQSCSCPVGLSSGDSHYVDQANSPWNAYPRCCANCGCRRWTSAFGGIIDLSAYIGGATWSIS